MAWNRRRRSVAALGERQRLDLIPQLRQKEPSVAPSLEVTRVTAVA
jgi:hypothetical protein